MRRCGLVCKLGKKRAAKAKLPVNRTVISNLLNRRFNNRSPLEVLVCDLTYIELGNKWAYLCPIIDL